MYISENKLKISFIKSEVKPIKRDITSQIFQKNIDMISF